MLARLSFSSSLFPPPLHVVWASLFPIPILHTLLSHPPSPHSDGTFINSLESSVCSAWMTIMLNIPERCSVAVTDDASRQWGKYRLPGKLSPSIRLKVSEAKLLALKGLQPWHKHGCCVSAALSGRLLSVVVSVAVAGLNHPFFSR